MVFFFRKGRGKEGQRGSFFFLRVKVRGKGTGKKRQKKNPFEVRRGTNTGMGTGKEGQRGTRGEKR